MVSPHLPALLLLLAAQCPSSTLGFALPRRPTLRIAPRTHTALAATSDRYKDAASVGRRPALERGGQALASLLLAPTWTKGRPARAADTGAGGPRQRILISEAPAVRRAFPPPLIVARSEF